MAPLALKVSKRVIPRGLSYGLYFLVSPTWLEANDNCVWLALGVPSHTFNPSVGLCKERSINNGWVFPNLVNTEHDFLTYFHELFWLYLLSTIVFLLYCTCSWRLCNSSFFDVPTHWTVLSFEKKLRKGYPRPRLLIYYKLRAFKCIDSYIYFPCAALGEKS